MRFKNGPPADNGTTTVATISLESLNKNIKFKAAESFTDKSKNVLAKLLLSNHNTAKDRNLGGGECRGGRKRKKGGRRAKKRKRRKAGVGGRRRDSRAETHFLHVLINRNPREKNRPTVVSRSTQWKSH